MTKVLLISLGTMSELWPINFLVWMLFALPVASCGFTTNIWDAMPMRIIMGECSVPLLA
jgi:hypothetical protein